jgi:uncharacterized membrane protein YdjX (TVP38/TMEM64 family)
VAAYTTLFAGIIAVTLIYRQEIWELASDPARLRDWVEAFGLVAPLIFIAVQVVQVVVFIIPGEVPQIAGGYLFGVAGGLGLTTLGITLGSALAFGASRLFGRSFLQAIVPTEQLERFGRLAGSPRATITFFLFFLIPGIPKDILCYVAGLSPMRFVVFITASTIGRLPGILGSVIMGNAAAEARWVFFLVVLGIATAFFVIGLALRKPLVAALERYSGSRQGTGADEPTPPPV